MLLKLKPRHVFHGLLSILEWKLGFQRLRSLPTIIRIEPAMVCNLRCPLCSTPWRELPHGQSKYLTFEAFRTIIAKVGTAAFRITFYMDGEPLLNRHLLEMVHHASKRGIFTSFSSNFTLATDRVVNGILESGLDFLSISLDGFHQETYQRYRVGGDVKKVLDAIAQLMRRRHQLQRQLPYVEVNMIQFIYINAEEEEQLRKFCNDNGVDRFVVRPEQKGLWGTYKPKFDRRPSRQCFWPYVSMSINADGEVYPCPIALEQQISAGNIIRHSVAEIWNGALYQQIRDYVRRKDDIREGPHKLPCFDCRWFGKSEATNPILKNREILARLGLPVLTDSIPASKAEDKRSHR